MTGGKLFLWTRTERDVKTGKRIKVSPDPGATDDEISKQLNEFVDQFKTFIVLPNPLEENLRLSKVHG